MTDARYTSASDVIARVRSVLSGRHEVVFAYLFGSVARDEARSGSDVDVAVYVDASTTPSEPHYRADLLTELMRALSRNDVDLLILNEAPVVLQQRALRDGLLILSRDDYRRVDFIADTLRRYVDTEPLRRLAMEYTRKSIQDGTFGRKVSYRIPRREQAE